MLASSLGGRVASEDWVKLLPLVESAHQTTPDSKEPDEVVQNEAVITEAAGHPSPPGALRCIHNASAMSYYYYYYYY